MLAYQLGRTDAAHLEPRQARRGLPARLQQDGNRAPWTPQERWENQSGYSPATIASRDRRARLRGGDRPGQRGRGVRAALPRHRRRLAGAGQGLDRHDDRAVLGRAVLPAPDQGRQPERRHHLHHRRQWTVQRGPAAGRRPQLPRPGAARRAAGRRPGRREHLGVIDAQLGVPTARGFFWHRASFDGYGEKANGDPWEFGLPGRLAHHAGSGVAAAQRRARGVPARGRRRRRGPGRSSPRWPAPPGRGHAARAGLGPAAAGRQPPASSPARRPPRRRRSPGRTPSSSGWRGTSRPGGCSSSRPRWPSGTRAAQGADRRPAQVRVATVTRYSHGIAVVPSVAVFDSSASAVRSARSACRPGSSRRLAAMCVGP